MPLTDLEIISAIAAGESRRVEFKGPRRLGDRHPRAEVMRAIFAMVNRRNGGVVFVGVNDNGTVPGLSAEQAASWKNVQRARQSAAASAQPAVDFDVDVRTRHDRG